MRNEDLDSFKKLRLPKRAVYGKNGKNLVHMAAKYCESTEILDYCIYDLKIKPSTMLKKVKSRALHIACKYGKASITKFLANLADANLEILDNNGETPLSLAAKHNHIDLVVYLQQLGASLHNCNKNGWTPLHWASKNGNSDLVYYLIQAGANPNALTNSKENCLHLAAESDCINTVSTLLDYVFPLLLSCRGTLIHHCSKNPKILNFVLANTPWKNFPKLPILLEINAPVYIIVEHCIPEIQGNALKLVAMNDREDLIKELYFKHVFAESGIEMLLQCALKPKCKKVINFLSKWQVIKKILFVYKFSCRTFCKYRLSKSLLREIVSCI